MSSHPLVSLSKGICRLILGWATVTIALQLDLLPKLLRSLAGWLPLAWPPRAPDNAPFPFDDSLHALYRLLSFGQPLLPWLLWVSAFVVVSWQSSVVGRRSSVASRQSAIAGRQSPVADDDSAVPAPANPTRHTPYAVLRITHYALRITPLLIVLLLGAMTRGANLLPDAARIWPVSSFDEQVYFSNARLLGQGELPYRDHFLAHPPGITYLLAPGLATQARWGGSAAFGAARQWMLLISLAGVALTFLVGRKLGGLACGTLAAGVLALDGRAAGVAVLETGVNLWSLAALLLYLYIPRVIPHRYRALWIGLAGLCCAAAILTKVPGLAIALALPLHALISRRPLVAAGLVTATAAGVLAGLAPFLLLAPEAALRQMVFFQLLRPQEVRPGIDEALRIAAYPMSLLTTTLPALGLALLAWAVVRGPWSVVRGPWSVGSTDTEPATQHSTLNTQHSSSFRNPQSAIRTWSVVPLWAVPVLAVFVVGRSYHAPYYVQWAPPLALLAGAIVARPVWQALLPHQGARRARLWRGVVGTGTAVAAVLLLPLAVRNWQETMDVTPDTVYRPAGATIRALTKPDDAVLSFDPGYAFVAGRPLAIVPGQGRLVDSAGAMTYYGLGIDQRPFADLWNKALHFKGERNAPAVFQSTAAQASVIGGFFNARLVVVDGKIGLPQLRGQTLGLLQGLASPPQQVEHVSIYSLNPADDTGNPFSASHRQALTYGPLQLRALTVEPLNADGSSNGAQIVQTYGETVPIQPGQVVQLGCYWQPTAPPVDTRLTLRLVNAAGRVLAQIEAAPDEDRAATHLWNPAFIYPDLRNLPIPPGTPPGDYRIEVGVTTPTQPAQFIPLPALFRITP